MQVMARHTDQNITDAVQRIAHAFQEAQVEFGAAAGMGERAAA